MVKMLLEYFTHIDEVGDFLQLWPTICHYLEIDLGWNMAISFLVSAIITLGIIAIPVSIFTAITTAIIKAFKNL